MNWIIAERYSFSQELTESGETDDLQAAIEVAETLAAWDQDVGRIRQLVICRNRVPNGWRGGRPRYVLGATDAELYRQQFGREMPIGSAAGALINSVDSSYL